MKKIALLCSLSLVLFSCSNDDNQQPTDVNALNKVLLLKLDIDTYNFEGGKELVYPYSETFTLSKDVQPLYTQNDTGIGSSIIKYDELNEIIFDANVFYDSPAQINYPQNFEPANFFSTIAEEVAMPELEKFENIVLDLYVVAPQDMEAKYPEIWSSIDNLDYVKQYRESNPDARIYVFQYGSVTESESWKWYVILKN